MASIQDCGSFGLGSNTLPRQAPSAEPKIPAAALAGVPEWPNGALLRLKGQDLRGLTILVCVFLKCDEAVFGLKASKDAFFRKCACDEKP
jgi:hypothetical protein